MSPSVKDRAEFHACLDCAMEILDLFETGGQATTFFGIPGRELHVDRVIEIIKLHYTGEINAVKTDMIGQLCADVIGQDGFNSCAMWKIAHNLDHIFYDPSIVTED